MNKTMALKVIPAGGFMLINPRKEVLELLLGPAHYCDYHEEVDTVKILDDAGCSYLEFFEQAILSDELLHLPDLDYTSPKNSAGWMKLIMEAMEGARREREMPEQQKFTLELTVDDIADLREITRKADACARMEKHRYGVGQDLLDACRRFSQALRYIKPQEKAPTNARGYVKL